MHARVHAYVQTHADRQPANQAGRHTYLPRRAWIAIFGPTPQVSDPGISHVHSIGRLVAICQKAEPEAQVRFSSRFIRRSIIITITSIIIVIISY